ncbi:maleylacetate reductase [Pseudomonas lurida]|jgi:alcohol dehydrogenase class IV|uniref:maleylacetate reductase n=1 Tax=Pseudomonas lurida TaxID=244566 RepID=UPI001644002C|nr:maleylacetate reductase [Pseudomonas lurida]MBC3244998.1 maleylacetate reductase [Pseudomonas lurida]
MQTFIYNALPGRIVFGAGRSLEVVSELERLGANHALVICSEGQADAARTLASSLGTRCAGVCSEAAMHTPVAITEHVLELVKTLEVNCLIALGGGSAIGLSKALALRTGLPQIVIPTTYAGSEVTAVLGETADGVKRTQRSLDVLPEVVIYDVEQTLQLPAAMSAASGMNALAHAAEALYSQDANPLISQLATQAIEALATSLPAIVRQPQDRQARSQAQYGAWLAGTCLGAVGMSLHHKLCHVLGGSFDLPHAETHAVMLPHAIAYNAEAAPQAMAAIAAAMRSENAPLSLFHLLQSLDLPISLKQLGMQESDLPRALELTLRDAYWSPRPLEKNAIRTLLYNAYHGLAPFTP